MANRGTVVGYFSTQAKAESAIKALKQAGFQQNQIGVAARSAQAGLASSTTAETTGTSSAYKAGHSAGGAWESVKSFFAGGSVEPYAGEATKETFNDRVITDDNYASDDVHHSLAGLSVPAEHARYFGHQLGAGEEGAVITVNAGDREEEALEILDDNGADIGDGAEDFDYGVASAQPATSQNVQLYGEVLRVHKDRVSSGEVRIRKDVVTTTQTVQVPVTREELVVERVPVTNQQVASNATFEGEEIRIPLTEERAIVEKQPVVREEVRIGKKEITNVESFDEQVRSEELKVDQTAVNIKGKSA
jgi:uncharacterized protein (TIGR02271 family)